MNIVVVGAGLSGLTVAATLIGAGANVQIVEADTQIGGRIRAVRDPVSNRVLADLGPTWVWPKYQPVVARWLKRLGLQIFEQFNDGDAVITGYGPVPLRQSLPGQDGIVRIVGGPSALIDALVTRIGHANIRTSAPVSAIIKDGDQNIVVRLASGEAIRADKVILSVPMRVAATTIHLPWAPKALLDAMLGTPTWMATQAKAVVLYDHPFWREQGLSGRIASRTGPLVEAHDHTGIEGAPGAVFGFVGWSPEQRSNDPQGLRRAIVDQLAHCFGTAAASPLDLVVQDWAVNPRIATDLDLSQPADHPTVGPGMLRQSYLDGRLRFAVSEASDLSPGLIEGALSIGERAASDML
ncbi:flavin monoamine oxidase family protein [Phaeobacter marinintestinus]|uniref:flavin monoamine oxidase family protein n=1 Tax=Falsiphaeobacter marinintestinus TaxID=1492905 RepID=UPI0011B375CE|nr:NAD(P)/FAD-dependent oxidoreductase [Phaeobacter marinintestinus]